MKKLLFSLAIFCFTNTLILNAQCPDKMYFLGIGSSYFFYNESPNPDICTQNPPASITIYDATAFCGPATFTTGGACLGIGSSVPPLLGQSYAQTDPVCLDPQIITPLVVVWGEYTCTYDGPAGSPYMLIASEACLTELTVNDQPIADNTYTAGETIFSKGFVPANGNVIFSAGLEVCLNVGFEVDTDGNFEAFIEGCE